MHRTVSVLVAAVGCSAGIAWAQPADKRPTPPSSPTSQPTTPPKKQSPESKSGSAQDGTLSAYLSRELDDAMASLSSGAKPADVLKKINGLFDLGAVHLQLPDEAETLRSIDAARLLLTQVTAPKNDAGLKLLPMLLANKPLAATFAMSVRPEDDVPQVYRLLASLNDKYPKQVADEKLANLVAAVCVVFDKPPPHPVLARTTQNYPAIDPDEVFNFFATNSARMQFPPATTPVELLIDTVNVAVSPEEMAWALQQYGGNRNVGKLYDTIVYDTDVLKKTGHDDKKVFKQPGGYTLQNIKKVGGVCEEQGFFASQVGKCIGVPTVYVIGVGNDVAHAYIGCLRPDGPHWDFSEGRYEEYKGLEGVVYDPQTGAEQPTTLGAISSMLMTTKPADRQRAIAIVDAATRLGEGVAARPPISATLPPEAPAGKSKPRTPGVDDQLSLLDAAIRLSPGDERGWAQVVKLGQEKKLPEAAKRTWADMAMRLAGRQYPDFAMWVITPLIHSMGSVEQQTSVWEAMSNQFSGRNDLAARCKFEQGEAWVAADNPDKAYSAFTLIIDRYANEGRMAIEALARIETLMTKKGMKQDALIPIYENAFRKINKPPVLAPDARRRTSYYIVGSRLADLYDAAGKKSDAERVRKMIDTEKEKKKGFGK